MLRRSLLSLRTAASYTDEELMLRVAGHGDARAFACLVERWQSPILRLCSRMLGDSHRGQDAAQEVFTRLFAKRSLYGATNDAKFSTFLWRLALNCCHDEIRKIKRRPAFDELPDQSNLFQDPSDPPDRVALLNDQAELVRRALGQLPEKYRTVLILRHYQQLKLRQIAEVLQVPPGTVYSRMAEAMRRLTNLLRPTLDEDEPTRHDRVGRSQTTSLETKSDFPHDTPIVSTDETSE